MARFLTTKEVEGEIERVIRGAQERLVLISPYLKLHQLVVERLGDAARRGVEIRLVCREGDLKDAQRAQLMALPRVQLFFMEHLHAKCYANERRLVLTSMNLYDASGKNREMGVSCEVGQELYRDAMAEAESIINNALPFHGAVRTRAQATSAPPAAKPASPRVVSARQATARSAVSAAPVARKVASSSSAVLKATKGRGYCVRCRCSIELNAERPFCLECFKAWNQYKNEDYAEACCHACGQRVEGISKRKPQCYKCWRA